MLAPSRRERLFDRFAELPADASVTPQTFQQIGGRLGMAVLGPPLAVTHPVAPS